MKRLKNLGILAAVFAVLSIATFALSRYEETQEQIKNSGAVILELPAESVTGLSWEYAQEGSLAFHKEDAGWVYDGDDSFPVSQEKIGEILSNFEKFSASFVIENVSDYSQYGLEKPACTLHITTEDTAIDMKLGDFSKMDEQRYVDIGDGNVYLVKDDPKDYVYANLSSLILHDDTPGFENVVDISFQGAENYTIRHLEDSGLSYSEGDVYFTQQDGADLPLDKSAVVKYLNTITTLDLMDYVTYNATQEDLQGYGLDAPELSVTVNYTSTGETDEDEISDTCVIHISRDPEELAAAEEAEEKGENAQSVSAYVRVGDSPIVYTLDQVDYGILSAASYDDLRHKEVFWGDFADVTQIDVQLEGKTHTLTSQLDDGEDTLIWYLRDEEEVDISDLTAAIKALSSTEFTSESPAGKQEIRLTLHLDKEAFPKVEIALYRYDGTSCLAVVDGTPICLVPRASAMEIVEAVQAMVLDMT